MLSAATEPADNTPGDGVMAALDLGSNSFHMKLARREAGRLVVVDRLREMVRLAAGLDRDGNLDQASQQRALDCLARFGQRIRDMRASTVRVVATNTFRKARKAGAFKRRAEEVLGHPIEVVSGREEARLVYSGVVHSSPLPGESVLVADIGGGSTELIVGEGFSPQELFSLQMGCVSITRRFFSDGKLSRKNFKQARLAVEVELEPVLPALSAVSWEQAAGASGTIRAAAAVIAAADGSHAALDQASLGRLVDRIRAQKRIAALSLPGLDPKRAPVFAGGVVILESLFKALKISSMRVSDGALREGILYDLMGRFTREDARERSVRALQQRYNVDAAQAERVEQTAVLLFRQLAPGWKLSGADNELLLRFAARTHEVGLAIAHAGYHRHGGYLLEHSDLAGFSTYEQARLAAIVALHRKQFRIDELLRVARRERLEVRRLAVILRLAVVLHRGRSATAPPEFQITAKKESVSVEFGAGWLQDYPLTAADLETEGKYLAAAGFRLAVA